MSPTRRPSTALVLTGGGARGAYEVGALQYILERFGARAYDILTGTSVGALNACFLAVGGAIECAGRDEYGLSSPPDGTWSQVSAGSTHVCALASADGSVDCWGTGSGDEDREGPYTQIAAGGSHNCALDGDGGVHCWGDMDLEHGKPSGVFTRVGAGMQHACVMDGDGEITCWGTDDYGLDSPPIGPFVHWSVGLMHGCGLRASGELACWGRNDDGETEVP